MSEENNVGQSPTVIENTSVENNSVVTAGVATPVVEDTQTPSVESASLGPIENSESTPESPATHPVEEVTPVEKPTASYRITGLVDHFNEQGFIDTQYPVGSIQILTTEQGDKAVQDGQAEREDVE